MIKMWQMTGYKLCFHLYAGHAGSESHSLSSYSVPGHSWPPLADLWMMVRYRDCVATVALSVKHEIQSPLKSYNQWQESSQSFFPWRKMIQECSPGQYLWEKTKQAVWEWKGWARPALMSLRSTGVRFQTPHPCHGFIWLAFWGSLHNSNDLTVKMVQLRTSIQLRWSQQTVSQIYKNELLKNAPAIPDFLMSSYIKSIKRIKYLIYHNDCLHLRSYYCVHFILKSNVKCQGREHICLDFTSVMC